MTVSDDVVNDRGRLCIFFLGKQAEENSKGLHFEILVGCIRIQAVRRPE